MALPKELMMLSKGELVRRYLNAVNSIKLAEEKFTSANRRNMQCPVCRAYHNKVANYCSACGEKLQ